MILSREGEEAKDQRGCGLPEVTRLGEVKERGSWESHPALTSSRLGYWALLPFTSELS